MEVKQKVDFSLASLLRPIAALQVVVAGHYLFAQKSFKMGALGHHAATGGRSSLLTFA